MSKDVIEPGGIPMFTGNLEQLTKDAAALTKQAGDFRDGGANVHKEFQGLSACYQAPEADQLFATTLPVKTKADDFADDLEKAATALTEYETQVRPLVTKLQNLRTEAFAFTDSIAGDDHWRRDQSKIDHNERLMSDVGATIAAFTDAERACHDKITALVGGSKLTVDDGSHKPGMYGYSADALQHAEETPWGGHAEREYTGLRWLWEQTKSFVWDGFIVDGIWGTIKGLGTLVGTDGWDKAGQAWTGLAKLATGLAISATPFAAAYWAVPDKNLPSWLRDSRTAMKETGKALVAWDEWGKNPARAAGGVTFNVLTTVFTGGAGSAAKGGAVAKVLSVTGKVAKVVDPMTYVAKAGKFGVIKVGDLFGNLKNITNGHYAGILANGGKFDFDGAYPKTADVPVVKGNYIEWPSGSRLNLDDGKVYKPDGTVSTAKVELSADDIARLKSTLPHEPALVGAHPAEHAGVHTGDTTVPGRVPGAAHDLGATASHETPAGPHGTGGPQNSVPAPHGDLGTGGHGDTGTGGHGGGTHPGEPGTGSGTGGGDDAGTPPGNGGSHLPEGPGEPRGNLPDGSWEGPQGLHLDPHSNAAADQFMHHAATAEPGITDAVKSAADRVDHGKLNGLEYRMKGEDSLKRKIATALHDDPMLRPEDALANVKDSLRYTVELPAKDYAHGVQQAVDDFRGRGFENVTFKNTWDSAGYKGINSTWRDPVSGQVFEVQFHTPESFTAKMDGHVLYEHERLPGISHDELAAIRAEQSELFGKVPVPHGAGDLHIDLGHEPHGSALPDAPHVDHGQHGPASVHGNGPPPELTPAERTVHDAHLQALEQKYAHDFDVLKQDPDHKGKVKPSEMDEARIALDMRDSGKVPSDIQRPPGANQGDLYSPSAGEFYDIKGVHSDWPPLNNVRDKSLPFKGAYDPANNGSWVRKLEDQIVNRKRVVILDMRNADQAAIDDVRAIVEDHGWSDRVVWYP
ncbi:hypothetical protein [Streptomyces sp. NBC_00083]|uniref:hypothetical protein n=1 Tax=Streptomyces sp. NBC_00083 TaxID=2975647 RepID=UPI00224E427C|nr:hypothetical protein [Streptomyces sp. NBC_00083]MCX5385667.1 hypothetical protein [Streptomyces sp. NBC_00083]